MEKEQFIKWMERLVQLKKQFESSQGQNRQDALNQLLGYIESGEYILNLITQKS